MAITELPLRFGLGLQEVLQIAQAEGLQGQSGLEVYECWDMLQIWQDWVSETFGDFTRVRHRSGTDDPPDLELIFQDGRVVAMEHTRLQPPHLGQASALLRRSEQGGFVPPISPPPANFAEMRDIISGVNGVWGDVIDEWKAIFDLLCLTLRRKMRTMPAGGIVGIVQDLVQFPSKPQMLADVARNIVDRPEFADFDTYNLIILNRSNHRQYNSSLVRRGHDPLTREGV